MSTLATILVFAQEAAHGAEHEETSKTLFYIVGGIAAAYGFLIGILGSMKPDFPGSKGAARGVFALSTVIVLAAMASSVVTG
jgi:hypothetical protein